MPKNPIDSPSQVLHTPDDKLPQLSSELREKLENLLINEHLLTHMATLRALGRFNLPFVMRYLVDNIKVFQHNNDKKKTEEFLSYAQELIKDADYQDIIESVLLLNEVMHPLENSMIERKIKDTLTLSRNIFTTLDSYIKNVLDLLPLYRTGTTDTHMQKYNELLALACYHAQQLDIQTEMDSKFLPILQTLLVEQKPQLVIQLMAKRPIDIISNVVSFLSPISKTTVEKIVINNWHHILESMNDEMHFQKIVSTLLKNNPSIDCLRILSSHLEEISDVELSRLAANYLDQSLHDHAEILFTHRPQIRTDIQVVAADADLTKNSEFKTQATNWNSSKIAGYILEEAVRGNSRALWVFEQLLDEIIQKINQPHENDHLLSTASMTISQLLAAYLHVKNTQSLQLDRWSELILNVFKNTRYPQLVCQALSPDYIAQFPTHLQGELSELVNHTTIKSILLELNKPVEDKFTLRKVLTLFSNLSPEIIQSDHKLQEIFSQLVLDTINNLSTANLNTITKNDLLLLIKICRNLNYWESGTQLIHLLTRKYDQLHAQQLTELEAVYEFANYGSEATIRTLLSKVAQERRYIPSSFWISLPVFISTEDTIKLMEQSLAQDDSFVTRSNYVFSTLFPTLIKMGRFDVVTSFMKYVSSEELNANLVKLYFKECVSLAESTEQKMLLFSLLDQLTSSCSWEVKAAVIENLISSNLPYQALELCSKYTDVPDQYRVVLFERIVDCFHIIEPNNQWMAVASRIISQFPINDQQSLIISLTKFKAANAINNLAESDVDLDTVQMNLISLINNLKYYSIREDEYKKLLLFSIQTGLTDFLAATSKIMPHSKKQLKFREAVAATKIQQFQELCNNCVPEQVLNVLKLNLPWHRLMRIWERSTYDTTGSIFHNLVYMAQLESNRPGAVASLTNASEYNISCFSRYPTELLEAMVDGIARESQGEIITPGYIFTVNDDNDLSDYTYQTCQKLVQVGSVSQSAGVTPMVIEFDGNIDFLKRIVALRRHTPQYNKAKYIIGITHGNNSGISSGTLSKITSESLQKPLPNNAPKEKLQASRDYKRVLRLAKSLKKQLLSASTELLLLSCYQGNPEGTAQLLSKIFGISVVAPEGIVAVDSVTARILPGKRIALSFKPIVGLQTNFVKGNRKV